MDQTHLSSYYYYQTGYETSCANTLVFQSLPAWLFCCTWVCSEWGFTKAIICCIIYSIYHIISTYYLRPSVSRIFNFCVKRAVNGDKRSMTVVNGSVKFYLLIYTHSKWGKVAGSVTTEARILLWCSKMCLLTKSYNGCRPLICCHKF